MTRLAGFLLLALVAFTGCNQGTPGGPGTTDKTAKKPIYGEADETFNLSVPMLSTTLKQGDKTEGSIGIKRGKNFDEEVTLAFTDLPKGVTADPASPVIKPTDTEVKVTFQGADDASLGDFTVQVTGHPTKGGDATNKFTLTVAKKDTFYLSAPFLSTTLKQGGQKEVSIGIKRDKHFDQDVTLAFADLPSGVTFDPASPVIKPGDTEAKLTLKGTADAAVGDFTVKVTGHPTKGGDATKEFQLTVAKKDTFHLSVPSLSTSLKQGDTKEISIGMKRDKNFDQDVTLTFADMPKGVTIDPASRVLKHGDADAKFTLKAADDAALGNFTLRMTGHPTVGADATNEFRLTVAKK
jgi:hypothetical protein